MEDKTNSANSPAAGAGPSEVDPASAAAKLSNNPGGDSLSPGTAVNIQSPERVIAELRNSEGDAWQKCAQLRREVARLRSQAKTTKLQTSLGWFAVVVVLIGFLVYLYGTKEELVGELTDSRTESGKVQQRIAELDRTLAAEVANHSGRLAEVTNELNEALRREKFAVESREKIQIETQKKLTLASNQIVELQQRLAVATSSRTPETPTGNPGTSRNAPQTNSSTARPSRSLTNSLGMIFVPITGTKVDFCIWETRVSDFRAFVSATRYDATAGAASLGKDHWRARGDTWMSPGFTSLQAEDCPVVGVSWEDAQAFCRWLSMKENRKYRLPTDAEWSAAAGPGKYVWGDEWPPPPGTGNFAGEEVRGDKWPDDDSIIAGYRDKYPWTCPVDVFAPNAAGVFNMGDNVAEWCEDWYRKSMNTQQILQLFPVLDDEGNGHKYRVLRGGSWADDDRNYLMTSFRYCGLPGNRVMNVGFRVVWEPK